MVQPAQGSTQGVVAFGAAADDGVVERGGVGGSGAVAAWVCRAGWGWAGLGCNNAGAWNSAEQVIYLVLP